MATLEDTILAEIDRENALGARRVNAVEIAAKVSPTGSQGDAINAVLIACESLEALGRLVSYMRIETYLNSSQPERWRYHYRFVR